ncbi:hypothetical protein [Streptomyces sp. NPDC023327]|uniref:hypothetical protein n=1 Tax=Streptomyces sp. NPDC023327 TaxID=3157088 RepID=UPI0033EA488C
MGAGNVKSAVSRAVVAVSIVAALGATAACGGSGDDGKKPAKSGAGSAKGGSGGAARLEKAALTTGDVKGYRAEDPKDLDAPDSAASAAGTASPTVCAPLAVLLGTGPGVGPGAVPKLEPEPEQQVSRVLTPSGGKDLTTTNVDLYAYDGAGTGAERVMAGLDAALKSKKCAAFRVGDHRYVGVQSLPAPDKGDAAISYELAHRKSEYMAREQLTVVREGGTLIVFDASNMYDPQGVQDDREAEREGMKGIGTPKADDDPKVAPVLVDAQLRKL